MIYSLDTSAFIEPWRKRYAIDVFPDFWEHLDELAQRRELFGNEEVLHDLERIDDDLLRWVKARLHIFLRTDQDVERTQASVVATYPNLIDVKRQRSLSDPWVIAHAQVLDATVVTEEEASRNPGKKPHIPDVCRALQVNCINVLEFMRRTQIRFRRV